MRGAVITVLVATGLHRPNEGQELAELVGYPVGASRTVTVLNHDARADEDNVRSAARRSRHVGAPRSGRSSRARIATGLVEAALHGGMGRAAARSSPTGIAQRTRTITTVSTTPPSWAHPRAANCVLDGKPLHEEQLAIVAMLGGAVALTP